jgi:hypothetical protein
MVDGDIRMLRIREPRKRLRIRSGVDKIMLPIERISQKRESVDL